MSSMFAGFQIKHFHLKSLSFWDVSKVETMEGMFRNARGFDKSNFSKWDVSKVTNMEGMFDNSKGSMNLTGWDVSRVTHMRGMFHRATGFQGLNLTKWNVRKIVNETEESELTLYYMTDLSDAVCRHGRHGSKSCSTL